jgi:hypothetical protein
MKPRKPVALSKTVAFTNWTAPPTEPVYPTTERLPVRVLGVGSNVLVRDEGVSGVVLRLCEAAFTKIEVAGRKVRAGGGAPLSKLISEAALQLQPDSVVEPAGRRIIISSGAGQ